MVFEPLETISPFFMTSAGRLYERKSFDTTMDVYTGTVERDKRETAGRVATAVLGNVQ